MLGIRLKVSYVGLYHRYVINQKLFEQRASVIQTNGWLSFKKSGTSLIERSRFIFSFSFSYHANFFTAWFLKLTSTLDDLIEQTWPSKSPLLKATTSVLFLVQT